MQTAPDEPFVPLTPIVVPPNERAEVNVTVLPQPDNVQPFEPLDPQAGGHDAAAGESDEPRVTLQRDGDRISAIHVQCTCGRSIELSCVYDPAVAGSTSQKAQPPSEP